MDEPKDDAQRNYSQIFGLTIRNPVPEFHEILTSDRPPYTPPAFDEGIDWDRIERLLWKDLKVDSFEVHRHAAEGGVLYHVVLRSGVVAVEGLDWHLEDAVGIAKENLIR